MSHVTAAYEADGWTVEDVSRRKVGWDVTCRRAGDERHVDIKGCSGSRPVVLLTLTRSRQPRDQHWVLEVAIRAVVAPAMTEYGHCCGRPRSGALGLPSGPVRLALTQPDPGA